MNGILENMLSELNFADFSQLSGNFRGEFWSVKFIEKRGFFFQYKFVFDFLSYVRAQIEKKNRNEVNCWTVYNFLNCIISISLQ